MNLKCKYITLNGRCGLKGCYAFKHNCYTQDFCKCWEPIANADRIRDMSNEELAEFINNVSGLCNRDAETHHTCVGCTEHYCRDENTLDWLSQPAEMN